MKISSRYSIFLNGQYAYAIYGYTHKSVKWMLSKLHVSYLTTLPQPHGNLWPLWRCVRTTCTKHDTAEHIEKKRNPVLYNLQSDLITSGTLISGLSNLPWVLEHCSSSSQMLLPDISGSAWKDAVVELVVRYQDLDRLLQEVSSSCLIINH